MSKILQPAERHRRAFTLVEVLAAIAFMAIVVPVAVEGVRVANLAGVVGQRKTVAARIAQRVLSEWLITNASMPGARSGSVQEGPIQYRWSIRTEPWRQDTMRVVTVQVFYNVQGGEYDVHLSTLTDNSAS